MTTTHRTGLVQKLSLNVKRILEKVTTTRSQRPEVSRELVNSCFALINRIIQVARDEFISLYLKNFDNIWISFLIQNVSRQLALQFFFHDELS